MLFSTSMRKTLCSLSLLALLGTPALAQEPERVSLDGDAFADVIYTKKSGSREGIYVRRGELVIGDDGFAKIELMKPEKIFEHNTRLHMSYKLIQDKQKFVHRIDITLRPIPGRRYPLIQEKEEHIFLRNDGEGNFSRLYPVEIKPTHSESL